MLVWLGGFAETARRFEQIWDAHVTVGLLLFGLMRVSIS
jgi:hypothetical protein